MKQFATSLFLQQQQMASTSKQEVTADTPMTVTSSLNAPPPFAVERIEGIEGGGSVGGGHVNMNFITPLQASTSSTHISSGASTPFRQATGAAGGVVRPFGSTYHKIVPHPPPPPPPHPVVQMRTILQNSIGSTTSTTTPSTAVSSAAAPRKSTTGENTGRWTAAEHQLFLKGLTLYGKQWNNHNFIKLIPTRSVVQIRTHGQKYLLKVAKLEKIRMERDGNAKSDNLSSKNMSNGHAAAASQNIKTTHYLTHLRKQYYLKFGVKPRGLQASNVQYLVGRLFGEEKKNKKDKNKIVLKCRACDGAPAAHVCEKYGRPPAPWYPNQDVQIQNQFSHLPVTAATADQYLAERQRRRSESAKRGWETKKRNAMLNKELNFKTKAMILQQQQLLLPQQQLQQQAQQERDYYVMLQQQQQQQQQRERDYYVMLQRQQQQNSMFLFSQQQQYQSPPLVKRLASSSSSSSSSGGSSGGGIQQRLAKGLMTAEGIQSILSCVKCQQPSLKQKHTCQNKRERERPRKNSCKNFFFVAELCCLILTWYHRFLFFFN